MRKMNPHKMRDRYKERERERASSWCPWWRESERRNEDDRSVSSFQVVRNQKVLFYAGRGARRRGAIDFAQEDDFH